MSRSTMQLSPHQWSAAAVLAVALAAMGTAHAGYEAAGTTAANFLSLGAGARALGMAGAALGVGDELGGVAWNAAAAGWLSRSELVLSHAGLANRSLQEWGAIGGPIARSQTRWAVTALYQGDGSFDGRDATGASTGSFSVSSVALGATLARQLGSRVSLGFGATAVRERIATVTGSGHTFDGGLMVRAGMFGFGFAAQNVGGQMRYGASRYPFPGAWGVGIGFTPRGSAVRVACDVNFPNAYHPDIRAGVEWTHRDAMALRAGYRKELDSIADPLSGPSFGLGVRQGGMWMDYGYLLSANGAGQHRMGLRFNFGRSGPNDGPLGHVGAPKGPDAGRDASRAGLPPPPGP